MDQFRYYAIKYKPKDHHYLPNVKAGFTHFGPCSVEKKPPRMFLKYDNAKRSLDLYLAGCCQDLRGASNKIEWDIKSSSNSVVETKPIKRYIKQNDRKREDFEIVVLSIITTEV